ncbi:MAG: hypothetical protein AB1473_16545 [Thermodesulfobacteriota bacterium]
MAERYRQFLGSKPGIVVELIDATSSPYRVRTEQGFEYYISAEDFRTYYRLENEPTPARWKPLITDPKQGMVNSRDMAEVMEVVHLFGEAFRDFEKARAFVRDALDLMTKHPKQTAEQISPELAERGWDPAVLTRERFQRLAHLRPEIRNLLLDDSVAVLQWLDLPEEPARGKEEPGVKAERGSGTAPRPKPGRAPAKKAAAGARQPSGMKNVHLAMQGDSLTVTVDLSQDFGPSKSGKNTIVASTSGNKTIPGREERIGLNVYRSESGKATVGRKRQFKNMTLSVEGDQLTITVDLSENLGPSKSGQTMLVASTGGNQTVFSRMEKIGLNIYRPLD